MRSIASCYHEEPRERAAWIGPFRMRRAIFFGTIINIVAFLPLMLLPGDRARLFSEFRRS